MKIYFQELNLQGFVNWFDVQVQEERAHAVGMINYLNDRGGKVELRAIEKPVIEGTTPLEVFLSKLTRMSELRLLRKYSGFPILCSFPMDRKVILFPMYRFWISCMFSDSFPLEGIPGS